jgi:predicted amidophosphoribosyltransferase
MSYRSLMQSIVWVNRLKFCPFCGNPLKEGHVFCGECGKKLDEAPTAAKKTIIQSTPPKSLEALLKVKCPKCGRNPRYDKGSMTLMCNDCQIHICPTCGQNIRYKTDSDAWYCDKCKKNAEVEPQGESLKEQPAIYLGDFGIEGKLTLMPESLIFIEKNQRLFGEFPTNSIKHVRSYRDSSQKTQTLETALGGLLVGGVIGGVAGAVYAATRDNMLEILFDDNGTLNQAKFVTEDAGSWIKPLSSAAKIFLDTGQRGKICKSCGYENPYLATNLCEKCGASLA